MTESLPALLFSTFLSGAFMMGLAVSAIVFLRSWREGGDSLFLFFALAFLLMAIERVPLALFHQMREPHSLVYLLRLVGFVFILWGIVHRNARPPRKRDGLKLISDESHPSDGDLR